MKRIFIYQFVIVAACMMASSCRSVKVSTESHRQQHEVSMEADVVSSIYNAENDDSIIHYRMAIDSLTMRLMDISRLYRELYVKDSTMSYQSLRDSVYVRDSSWSVVNDDGSVSHYKNTETHRVSHVVSEKYTEKTRNDWNHVIDSLVYENARLIGLCDSLSVVKAGSVTHIGMESHIDSVYMATDERIVTEKQKSWFERMKERFGEYTLAMFVAAAIAAVIYAAGKVRKIIGK